MADFNCFVYEDRAAYYEETLSNPGFAFGSNRTPFVYADRVAFYEEDGTSYCSCVVTATPIRTVSITPAQNQLTIQFSSDIILGGAALSVENWIVSHLGGANDVFVLAIHVSGPNVILTTTPQTGSAAYTLNLPTSGITDNEGNPFTGLFALDFSGVATVIAVQMVKTVDARTIDVIFGFAVNPTDASNINNYAINNGLEVLGAVRISDYWYRLTTTRQVTGTNYTLTVSNIGPL